MERMRIRISRRTLVAGIVRRLSQEELATAPSRASLGVSTGSVAQRFAAKGLL